MASLSGTGTGVVVGGALTAVSTAFTWATWPGGDATLLSARTLELRIGPDGVLPMGSIPVFNRSVLVAVLLGAVVCVAVPSLGSWSLRDKLATAIAGLGVASAAGWVLVTLQLSVAVRVVVLDGTAVAESVGAGIGPYLALAGGVGAAWFGLVGVVTALFGP